MQRDVTQQGLGYETKSIGLSNNKLVLQSAAVDCATIHANLNAVAQTLLLVRHVRCCATFIKNGDYVAI